MLGSSQTDRLPPNTTQAIDRAGAVEFEFDGKPVRAYLGDTIASALYASGVRIFSRSFKYHRPRGLLCVAGRCPNCLMQVDGVPNVRACIEPVRDGMVVRHQNAWPSLERDFLSVIDRFHRLLPVGFYYKAFHRPKLLWRVAEPLIRRAAGLGSIDIDSVPENRHAHENRHTEVAVVGGGPAGMSAALAASAAGARVVLIDDQPALGGHLRYIAGTLGSDGREAAGGLANAVDSAKGVEVLSGATAFGLYEGNLLGVVQADRMVKLRAKTIVVATGAHELPLAFDRNDLPGVMLSTGFQRLVNLYGVKPGSTALVATTNDQGYYAALDLLDAGVRLAAVADSRPGFPEELAAAVELRALGVLVLPSHALIRAEGARKVWGAAVSRLVGGRTTTEQREFDCDLIAVSGGFQPADALLRQAGVRSSYDATLDEFVPGEPPATVKVAGEVTGVHDLRTSMLQGRAAGAEAAAVSRGTAIPGTGAAELQAAEATYRSRARAVSPPVDLQQGAKQFVCFCEDVTARDISDAVQEGFDDIQTLKRYTTATMGPCQGKMCLNRLAALCAEYAGRGIDEAELTTARPPVQPVTLGALAGSSHMPIKRTAMHHKHLQRGATMVDLGPWRRAHRYGSPLDETLAVRQRVGIIDVSTLGKLDVSGRDAGALMDKVYTHHFSNLRPGRIRYGVLCTDSGTILDDGTVTRMADDRYFVTTTTGNVELIEEWFKWWRAGTVCAPTLPMSPPPSPPSTWQGPGRARP